MFPIKRHNLYITSSHFLNPGYLRNSAVCIGFVQRGRSLLQPSLSPPLSLSLSRGVCLKEAPSCLFTWILIATSSWTHKANKLLDHRQICDKVASKATRAAYQQDHKGFLYFKVLCHWLARRKVRLLCPQAVMLDKVVNYLLSKIYWLSEFLLTYYEQLQWPLKVPEPMGGIRRSLDVFILHIQC